MITLSLPQELERFRAAVGRRLGLNFDDAKLGLLADILQRRAKATGSSMSDYVAQMERHEASREELRALAEELTVAETYFFRNLDQCRAFAEIALPARLAARAAFPRLRILSVGCASGDEAYSLAILVREGRAAPERPVSITGVDINAAMLRKAAEARYSAWSLRETPAPIRQRWFAAAGGELVLDPSIREAVSFEERNLVEENADLWRPGENDIVFCRNLIMYFMPEKAQELVSRITRSLAPGGYLFLGHAESLRGLSQDYHLRHTHGTFYYQRQDRSRPSRSTNPDREPPRTWRDAEPCRPRAPDEGWADNWVATVQRVSDRIQALAARQHAPESPPSPPARSSAPRPEMTAATELLKEERFAAALEVLRCMPQEPAHDPAALLLRAALLTHSGSFDAAQAACAEVLELDPRNAGAHYLLALCREADGDRSGAVQQHEAAARLDPAFAMPRLHLGLLARRSSDHEAACRELGKALALLQEEEASRLVLFGGGFGREALVALCKSELAAAGGKA